MTPSEPAALAPYWASPMATLYLGSAATVLAQLPAESVDMAVTSPPFWGLRNYHVDGQIGIEKTPEEWLEHIVAVFREVRRVLRPWGTLWCEIGDSYWGGKGASGYELPHEAEERHLLGGTLQRGHHVPGDMTIRPSDRKHPIIKPLDLVGIPFRLALALQADGWWLRSVIIWDKPAPMPESVSGWRWVKCKVKVAPGFDAQHPHPATTTGVNTGQRYAEHPALFADCPGCPKCSPNGGLVLRKGSWRPTESHSYILMLAKSANYFCNGEAVREGLAESTLADSRNATGRYTQNSEKYQPDVDGAAAEPSWYRSKTFVNPATGRNLRSVWRIGPEPSSLPHFATFPTALPEKCILAGTSEWGNCPRCGMPWAPVIKQGQLVKSGTNSRPTITEHFKESALADSRSGKFAKDGYVQGFEYETTIIGWRPSCSCGLSERVSAVVLDPFTGTSSTGVAAQRLGRKFIGIDMSEPYLKLSIKRLESVSLPLEAR